MTIKARIKTATLEVEYEGAVEFFKNEFLEIIGTLKDQTGTGQPSHSSATRVIDSGAPAPSGSSATTRSLASRLGVKTGPDLLMAAAGRLHLVEDRASFKRQDLWSRSRANERDSSPTRFTPFRCVLKTV